MTIVKQALIAVGGSAQRMTQLSSAIKAFEPVGGEPALFWTLCSLRKSGIRNLVLAVDVRTNADIAIDVATRAGFDRTEVTLVLDRGLGVAGLPLVAERYLAPSFVFDASHSMLPWEVYREFLACYPGRNRALLYASRASNTNPSRYRLRLNPGGVKKFVFNSSLYPITELDSLALSLPYVLERKHLGLIYASGYSTSGFIDGLMQDGNLLVYACQLQPEFDTDVEMRGVIDRVVDSMSGGSSIPPTGFH